MTNRSRSEYDANEALSVRVAPTIHPTAHEKAEWSRMAQAAYRAGYNKVGHRFSVAASLSHAAEIPAAKFDALQRDYRAWLCFNEFN